LKQEEGGFLPLYDDQATALAKKKIPLDNNRPQL